MAAHASRYTHLNRLASLIALTLVACSAPARMRLPDTGLAHSPDGRVAFVRATPKQLVITSLGDEEATELWLADSDGSHARRLVAGSEAGSVEHAIAMMHALHFSPDGRRIYFLSRAWVTSDAIHAVDVATGRERFVAPGNSLMIIPRGPLAGCLLVEQHRYWPNERGSYDWTWVLTSDGKEITVAAPDSDGAEQRVATWMSGAIPDGAFRSARAEPSNLRCS